jgi:hypothetical protein
MQQPPGQHLLAGPGEPVERRVDQGAGAALDQRQQPQLRPAAGRPAERPPR